MPWEERFLRESKVEYTLVTNRNSGAQLGGCGYKNFLEVKRHIDERVAHAAHWSSDALFGFVVVRGDGSIATFGPDGKCDAASRGLLQVWYRLDRQGK